MPRRHMTMDMVTERNAIPVAMPWRKPTVPDTITGMITVMDTRTARRKKKQRPRMPTARVPTARMRIELMLELRALLPG